MTYYGGKEMAASFRTVRANTLKIAEEIPEDKYNYRAAEGTKTVGEMLTHVAFGPKFHPLPRELLGRPAIGGRVLFAPGHFA